MTAKLTQASILALQPRKPKWFTVTQHMVLCTRPGATLTVVITATKNRGYYGAVAVETRADESTLGAVLDDHGHHLVGEKFKTLKAAMKASDAYVAKWLRGADAATCACGDIEPKPKRPARRSVFAS